MGNVLLIMPSELWGSILEIIKSQIGILQDVSQWGEGQKPSLQEFLDTHLSEMAYDENVHIITKVNKVEYESRCPYYSSPGFHEKCGRKKE